jgi:hypothetical protein
MFNPSTGDRFRDGTFALAGGRIVPSLNLNLSFSNSLIFNVMLQGRV